MINSIKDTLTLNNGVQMPYFGLGVYLAEGAETASCVVDAVDAGYRLIDTATIYENERGVGEGIKQCNVAREELFITSKVWNDMQGYDNTLKAFENSLKELDLEYLDLYLIHWPVPNKDKYVDTWKAMERLYKEKRIRAIGISNFYEPWIKRIIDECEVVPAVNQMEFHPYLQRPELRQYCKQNEIAYQGNSPLVRGAVFKDAQLLELAQKYNKNVAQLVLKFAVQMEVLVIPKSVHKDRIISNADIFDFEISAEDMQKIVSLDRNELICGPDPETFEFL